jgi:hypothetical protein
LYQEKSGNPDPEPNRAALDSFWCPADQTKPISFVESRIYKCNLQQRDA